MIKLLTRSRECLSRNYCLRRNKCFYESLSNLRIFLILMDLKELLNTLKKAVKLLSIYIGRLQMKTLGF